MVRLAILLSILFLALEKPGFCESPVFFVSAEGQGSSLVEGADFSKLADFVSSSVVDIETESQHNVFLNDPFFQPFFSGIDPFSGRMLKEVVRSSGSAVIISESGHMVSCAHVVEGASKVIAVLSDGRKMNVEVLASYPEVDLAILKLSNVTGLKALKLGKSSHLKRGACVAAIGNSFNLGLNFTNGIISAIKRRLWVSKETQSISLLQHNAAINPGNSGGALVDEYGNFIGCNNAIYSKGGGSNGVGFAIPVDLIKLFLQKYISQTKDVDLGIEDTKVLSREELHAISQEKMVTLRAGLLIESLVLQGAAKKAGLQRGDVIISAGEMEIETESDLLILQQTAIPQKPLEIRILRKGKVQTINLIPEEARELKSASFSVSGIPFFEDVVLAPLTPQLKAKHKLSPKLQGILVAKAPKSEQNAPEQNFFGFPFMMGSSTGALLQEGDLIVALNNNDKSISNEVSFKKEIKKAFSKKRLTLKILRGNSMLSYTLPLQRVESSKNNSKILDERL